MSEEEFFNRLINKIAKEFGYDTASTLELMFMTREKKVEQLEKENIKQKEIIENLTTMTVCGDKKQIKNTAQYKLEQLENIRKEAIEYVSKHIQEYDVDGTFTNLDEFDFIASPQVLLNILNKGE